MEARVRALEVWQRDGLYLDTDALHGLPNLRQALGVRSESLADRQQAVIHPEEIAAFRRRIAAEPREDRHAKGVERSGHRFLFASSEFLSHPEDDRPAIGHDGRIVHEDRIRLPPLRVLMISNVDPGLFQQVDEPVVLPPSRGEVGFRGVSPRLRIRRAERGVRPPHEDRAERIRHALASIGTRQAGPPSLERVPPSYCFPLYTTMAVK